MEMKKVVWPSRKEIISSTVVVIIAVFLVGVYLGIVDRALGWVVQQVFLH